MKYVAIVFLISVIPCALRAQSPTPSDSLFIVTYVTGPAWDAKKPPNEQPHFKEHSANLSAWRKDGIIRFGARYADKGIIFLTASSLKAARERIMSDQGVSGGLFVADVQPLMPFYYGCIEKLKP
jgi:hypothetical protein